MHAIVLWWCLMLTIVESRCVCFGVEQLGRVTDLCCCDNSHSLAAASTRGEISVFKVEYGRLRATSVQPQWRLKQV